MAGGIVRVGKESDIRLVAGSICHKVRENLGGAPLQVCSLGKNAINNGVKALCIASRYLASDEVPLYLSVRAAFDGGEDMPDQLTLSVTCSHVAPPAGLQGDELTAARKTNPWKLAGAVAGRFRAGEPVSILSKGADAILNAMRAISRGEGYLNDGEAGAIAALSFTPTFVERPYERRRNDDDDGEEPQFSTFVLCAVSIYTTGVLGPAPAAGGGGGGAGAAAGGRGKRGGRKRRGRGRGNKNNKSPGKDGQRGGGRGGGGGGGGRKGAKGGGRVKGGEMGLSLGGELEKIAALRAKGILTAEEFLAAKASTIQQFSMSS